jgi:hypothetical protein
MFYASPAVNECIQRNPQARRPSKWAVDNLFSSTMRKLLLSMLFKLIRLLIFLCVDCQFLKPQRVGVHSETRNCLKERLESVQTAGQTTPLHPVQGLASSGATPKRKNKVEQEAVPEKTLSKSTQLVGSPSKSLWRQLFVLSP